MNMPKYPVYIPSKGRWDQCFTAQFMIQDQVPFKLVIEAQEYDNYARIFGADRLLVLPFSNQGSVIPARNWIKQHSIEAGFERHWQFDDNIKNMVRCYKGKRIPCRAGLALKVCEDFTDRYENIAISGFNYTMFGLGNKAVFALNVHVYSCCLFLNSTPHKWRGKYNEDTDICLQVLADGWCTVLLNSFQARKMKTMTMKGGNTSELYRKRDGRLKMARALERNWPGVVTVNRRFQRPQHMIYDAWKRFDTPLKLKPDVDLEALKGQEYKIGLRAVKEIESDDLQELAYDFINKNKTKS